MSANPRCELLWLVLVAVASILASAGADIVVPQGVTCEVYVDDVPMCQALAFDSAGRLYVAHDGESTHPIYVIDPNERAAVAFGPAVRDPDAVAVDAGDNVYIGTGSGRVYRVTPAGSASVFADRLLGNVCALVVDHAGIHGHVGDLFVGNARATNDIVRVDTTGSSEAFVVNSTLYVPFGLAMDDLDSLYVAESASGKGGIYKVDSTGQVSAFVQLDRAQAIVFDPIERLLYVSETTDRRVYRIGLDGRVGIYAEGVDARGLAFGPDGDLYVSDRTATPNRILRFSGRGELRQGDLDTNGRVDMIDFAIFAAAWQTQPGDANWNAACDLTIPRDDIVDEMDLQIFAACWLDDYTM